MTKDMGLNIKGKTGVSIQYSSPDAGTQTTDAITLGHDDAADLLEETLEEEKAADAKLTEVAEPAINIEAASSANINKAKNDIAMPGPFGAGFSRDSISSTPFK